MSLIRVLFIILLFGVMAAFAVNNYETVSITVPFDKAYDLPKISLMVICTLTGALVILLVVMVRDTRRFFFNFQYQRLQKRDEKIHAMYSRALNAIMAEDYTEARIVLEDILKVDSGYTDAMLRLGDIALRKGRAQDAHEYFRRALVINPKDMEALFSLVKALEATGRWRDALMTTEQIIELDGDNLSALHKKRSLLERENRWDQVLDVQKDIIKLTKDDKDLKQEQAAMIGYRYEQARESFERGDLEKAGKGFKNVLKDDPTFVPAYLIGAEIMLAEGDSEGAVSLLEEAYEKTSSQVLLARIEDMLISLGEPARLIRFYRRAVGKRPRNDALKFFLAKLYFRLEMIDDAFEALSTLESSEAYPDVYKLLGELYLRRDQCLDAVREFKKHPELRRSMRLPYCCDKCGRAEDDWSGRCPACGSWNTLQIRLHGVCKL